MWGGLKRKDKQKLEPYSAVAESAGALIKMVSYTAISAF